MKSLIVGASGATGRLLVKQLLHQGQEVRAIVRSRASSPPELAEHPRLELIEANLLELTDADLVDLVRDCDAVASCLGHNLTIKGLFGQPRRLVLEATRRLCQALKACDHESPRKFLLMNTAGNSNRDLTEPISRAQSVVVALIRTLVPPHADNEQAADFLRCELGPSDSAIEWVVIRPDSLTKDLTVSPYDLHPSPTRSAIFNPGQTSRINVAHFMARLVTEAELWSAWRGQMPVIYNREV